MPKARQLKDVDDPVVAVQIVGHPLRVAIIAALEELHTASPQDVAKWVGVPVEKIAYHFRVLAKAGAIEFLKIDTTTGRPRRVYRMSAAPFITPEAWTRMPEFAKAVITGNSLDHLSRVTAAAAATGCITRPDALVGRYPFVVDDEAFSAMSRVIHETVAKLGEIEQRAAERINRGASHAFPATVVAMLFETPDPAAVMALDREPERRPRYRREDRSSDGLADPPSPVDGHDAARGENGADARE